MFSNPSLVTRVSVGKGVGLLLGAIAFFMVPSFWPEVSSNIRWGLLFWYATIGAFVGMAGAFTFHPILGVSLPWWFRGTIVGGWLNFVLMLFMYDKLLPVMVKTFGEGALLSSPSLIIAEGMVAGIIIDYFCTKFGGEGMRAVQADSE